MLIVLMLSANSVWAEWTEIGQRDDATAYLDFSTIRRTGNLLKVWGLFDFKTTRTYAGKSYMSAKSQSQFDCQEEQIRILAQSEFSKNMGRGDLVYSTIDPGKWRPVEPESISETVFKIVCDKK
jgi:hypothetical protein